MGAKRPLKQILQWQKFLEAERQFYEFAEWDIELLRKNKILSYCIDAYDINTMIFSKDTLSAIPDTHYEITKSNWEGFIRNTKDDPLLNVLIGPLAILEIIIYLHRHAQHALIDADKILKFFNIEQIIKQLEESGIKSDPTKVAWSSISIPLRKAWDAMTRVDILINELGSSQKVGLFKLFKLISDGSIQYVEEYFNQYGITCPSKILLMQNKDLTPEQGSIYLDSKRGDDYWQQVYNQIDMSRLIAAANLKHKLAGTDLFCFATSHGQLTLNAWRYSWKGEMSKWPARPSAVAAYLSSARKLEGDNWVLMKEKFEEGRCDARRIYRALDGIPTVKDCADPEKRRRLSPSMSVEVPDELVIDILHFLRSHWSEFCPKGIDQTLTDDVLDKGYRTVDLVKLYEWLSNAQKRKYAFNEIKQHASAAFENKDFINFDNFEYYNPIGDAYIRIKDWIDEKSYG